MNAFETEFLLNVLCLLFQFSGDCLRYNTADEDNYSQVMSRAHATLFAVRVNDFGRICRVYFKSVIGHHHQHYQYHPYHSYHHHHCHHLFSEQRRLIFDV